MRPSVRLLAIAGGDELQKYLKGEEGEEQDLEETNPAPSILIFCHATTMKSAAVTAGLPDKVAN